MSERIREIIMGWQDSKNEMQPEPLANGEAIAGHSWPLRDGKLIYFLRDRVRVFESQGDPRRFTDHFVGETFSVQVNDEDGNVTTFTYELK